MERPAGASYMCGRTNKRAVMLQRYATRMALYSETNWLSNKLLQLCDRSRQAANDELCIASSLLYHNSPARVSI